MRLCCCFNTSKKLKLDNPYILFKLCCSSCDNKALYNICINTNINVIYKHISTYFENQIDSNKNPGSFLWIIVRSDHIPTDYVMFQDKWEKIYGKLSRFIP